MHDSMTLFSTLSQGHVPPRIPVALNLIDQGAIEMGLSTEEYFSRADFVAEGQFRLKKKYGHDVVWGGHYVARLAEILGSRHTVFPRLGPPNVGDLVIRSYKDIENLQIPSDIEAHPSFEIQARTISLLFKEYGNSTPICAFQVGTFTLPAILMGMNAWMELLLEGPVSLVEELLTKCCDFSVAVFKAFRRAGATFVASANPCASTDFFPLDMLRKSALPWIQREIQGTGSDGFIYFSGGARIGKTIPMLMESTPISVVYLNPFDDIATAKRDVYGRALLIAPVNDISLVSADVYSLRSAVRRIIVEGGADGGFVLGSLVMPCQIPEENIHAVVSAAHEFGSYASTTLNA